MKGQGYVSVKSEEAANATEAVGVDKGTARFAMAAALVGCAVSLAAIGFIVHSLRPEQN